MENRIFKPRYDKSFVITWAVTVVLVAIVTVIAVFSPVALAILIIADAATVYFLVSPLFGYVELRESTVFIKFGFFMTREIPYERIRGVSKDRKLYSESTVSLKSALEHVNIKYNTFDVVSVSVRDNDALIEEISKRTGRQAQA